MVSSLGQAATLYQRYSKMIATGRSLIIKDLKKRRGKTPAQSESNCMFFKQGKKSERHIPIAVFIF
jgi:hypothetical protein